ncbi:MAG: DNA integrity scanning protein DisA nucleotide-binding domain protein [Nitriliruptorales bacterium]|nr:DNA integrity scanning protein DisA nucleotide-binding domain protein [Nitriliruptorales bacterium]
MSYVATGGTDPTTGQLGRLRDELVEERLALPMDGPLGERILEELAYARGPRVHETRVPTYGCVILADVDGAVEGVPAEFVPARDVDTATLRRFADGFRIFLIAVENRTIGLACLDEHAGEERALIRFVRRSGALVVRRADDGHVSVVTQSGVIVWDGMGWLQKPHADRVSELLEGVIEVGDGSVLTGVMELCLHWLMPARIGATIVWHPTEHSDGLDGLEQIAPLTTVPVNVTNHLHLPAFLSAVAQTDGALLLGPKGEALAYGATLLPSDDAVDRIAPSRGTRHTSAHRFSFDHPTAVLVVVSEDGPLTLYSAGERIDLVLP